MESIDEKEKVIVFAYKDLEAVISKVCLEEFASEAIQIRAQNDLKWIKEKVVIHERVIEEAMRENGNILSVIPMRFGTIFQGEENLLDNLNKNYAKFKSILEKLEGKQEWTIKVYLKDKERFGRLIEEENEVIKEKRKEISAMPEGMAFFKEEELKELILEEMDRELDKIKRNSFEKIKTYAEGTKEGRILEKELTGRLESMILNVSCLIKQQNLEDFKKGAQMFNQEVNPKGFIIEYSGPWPAYNFVS